MAFDSVIKNRPVVGLTGAAAGTSGIIDTSGYLMMQLICFGTTGSCNANVYINAGTRTGTLATTMPECVFSGSTKATGTGGPTIKNINGLTDQAIITHSSITGTYVTSYVLTDSSYL